MRRMCIAAVSDFADLKEECLTKGEFKNPMDIASLADVTATATGIKQ